MSELMSAERLAELRRMANGSRGLLSVLRPEEVRELIAEVDRLQAALARVADDSMQLTLQAALHRQFCDAPRAVCDEDAGEGGAWWHECGVALAAIRAVVADGQEVEHG